jgi:hypothetical protein
MGTASLNMREAKMDRQQIGLKLVMDAIGLPVTLATFDERLILQKAVCLAQAAGVDLGYDFNWYLRGPYSPALTRDAFAVSNQLGQENDESQNWNLDEKSSERLRGMRRLFQAPDRHALATRLELLASTWFLLERKRAQPDDVDGLQEILKRFGKDYTPTQLRDGLRELKDYGLCPAGTP